MQFSRGDHWVGTRCKMSWLVAVSDSGVGMAALPVSGRGCGSGVCGVVTAAAGGLMVPLPTWLSGRTTGVATVMPGA